MTRNSGTSIGLLAASLMGLIALIGPVQRAGAAGIGESFSLDCGSNALFVLLALEGVPVSFERLESSLPVRPLDGYSMAELSVAARSLGLRLEALRYTKGGRPPHHAAIAFLKDAKGGHFSVLRPVGTTGTMVQVIDPPRVPWITDYDELTADPNWTGRLLVPHSPSLARQAAPWISTAAGIALLAIGIKRQRLT